MSLRLRFLLDTNVLIPLQDSYQVLEPNLANFVRLAGVGGHQLLYHPATVADFVRDPNGDRRRRNLQRLKQYTQLDNPAVCPWNKRETASNDVCDNDILYAVVCDAVHALITEDRGIHAKARSHGLGERVHTIQMAEEWLRRLHEPRQVHLPNIEDIPLHSLTPILETEFFDSLRATYRDFDAWFRRTARDDRRAWIYRDDQQQLAALCIYTVQTNEVINDGRERLQGDALKLCTFKVGEKVRGRKIGELFLKAAFRYATENACEHIFIHANAIRQDFLVRLLEDFGLHSRGTYGDDVVLVKEHPHVAPAVDLEPHDYALRYFPHFRHDAAVRKFLIPIQPQFHDTLFPDYSARQRRLFDGHLNVGNAIKLAYLSRTPTRTIRPGDVLLFYRTADERAVTTVGIVDDFHISQDSAEIASMVSRRTVYSQKDIDELATQETKVILFRSVEHLPHPVNAKQLHMHCGITGAIQSIRRIQDDQFLRVLKAAGRPDNNSVS